MKTYHYIIGRDDANCDIVIDDPSNVTSGKHAILKIDKKGKYTIVDCSTNGTYVNGIKIEPHSEVEITRNDTISFARVLELDWSLVPNPARKRRIAIFSAIGAVLLISLIAVSTVLCVKKYKGGKDEGPAVESTDSLSVKKDSLETAVADTTASDENDSVREYVEKSWTAPKSSKKSDSEDKTTEENAEAESGDVKEEDKQVTNPII